MTPTARALERLRRDGWIADKVEQTLPIPGRTVTRDVYGFADILAAHPQRGILLVQVTSRSNVNARITKATAETVEDGIGSEEPNLVRAKLIVWLSAGGLFEVHGWAKAGPRGAPKRWMYRRVIFEYAERILSWCDAAEDP